MYGTVTITIRVHAEDTNLDTINYVKCKYVPFSKQYKACGVGEKKQKKKRAHLVPPTTKGVLAHKREVYSAN